MKLAILALAASTAMGASRDTLLRGKPVLDAVYSLDYERAIALAERLQADHPGDPLGAVLLARVYWSQQLSVARALSIERYTMSDFFSDVPRYKIAVEPEADRRFRAASQTAIAQARTWLAAHPSDPAALFLAGLAYQNQASYEFSIRGERWAAFKAGERALHYFRDALAADPAFADPRLAVGIAEYVADSVPWGVRWLSFMLGYRGSKERGKRELETAAERATLIGDDARTILTLFYTRDKLFDRALAQLTELQRKHPRNYLVHLEMAQAALSGGNAALAVSISRAVVEKTRTRADGYDRMELALPLLRLGVALRAGDDLAGAERELRDALRQTGISPRTATIVRLELGKTLDRMNRRQDAAALYREVSVAADATGSQREARSLLSNPYKGK